MPGRRRRRPEEEVGRRRLRTGALLGLSGALLSIGVPAALVIVAELLPSVGAPPLATIWSIAVPLGVVGAILLAVSLFLYRRAFAALGTVDPRLRAASALCLAGTLGTLLLVVAAIALVGSIAPVGTCLGDQPSRLFHCLATGPESSAFGVDAAIAGFVLAWIGGLGIALGLGWEGGRTSTPVLTAAGFLYGLLLLVLVGPLAAFVHPFSGAAYLFVSVPILAVGAPALVVAGSDR